MESVHVCPISSPRPMGCQQMMISNQNTGNFEQNQLVRALCGTKDLLTEYDDFPGFSFLKLLRLFDLLKGPRRMVLFFVKGFSSKSKRF